MPSAPSSVSKLLPYALVFVLCCAGMWGGMLIGYGSLATLYSISILMLDWERVCVVAVARAQQDMLSVVQLEAAEEESPLTQTGPKRGGATERTRLL
jgi:hypothetical protein